jgi:transposase InsO family protein
MYVFDFRQAQPSRPSTSLCLLHSVFDKSAWLRDREISEPWPVAGLSGTLHVFNGPDFRSRAFKRGCEDAGIAIAWRPPGEPRFGGHIERLIGTQMGKLHLLPGTTFNNEQDLCDYDSKRHAALTLRELERYVALDIVGSYHQSIHSSLSRPPIAVWQEQEGEIPLRLPLGDFIVHASSLRILDKGYGFAGIDTAKRAPTRHRPLSISRRSAFHVGRQPSFWSLPRSGRAA